MPWKVGHRPLPTNYPLSFYRLKGQLKKLKQQPEILDTYDKVIKDQLKANIIEEVTELERPDKVTYLPHQAVVRSTAETTKLRVVYDASAKEGKSGASLNNCLHAGPPLNPLLFDIMVRFREKEIGITADIEKAFLNVEVNKDDRDCLRFLWVDYELATNPEIKIYHFNRVVFGVNCSPFLLNAVLRYHLSKYKEEDPEFSATLSRSFYVDDIVLGCKDVNEGKELYEKSKVRMMEGGFNLRKWKTNDQLLAEEFKEKTDELEPCMCEPNDDTYAKEMFGRECSDSKTKVLGLTWDMVAEKFEFDLIKVCNDKPGTIITKRSILSMIAKLFDPLGLVSPIIVGAKVLFQELCTMKIGWDDELPEQMQNRWKGLIDDLNAVGTISLPRCLYKKDIGQVKNCYLHGFADASKKAYCALVYLVYETEEGMNSRLVCAKTRVAPLKELSIPRLELMSGRILSTLMKTVYNALTPQVKIDGCKYWLDSKTALFWINNQGEWRQFVQHRVNEILRITKKEDWGHCARVCNPADLGSRGVSASTLLGSRLWWEGPHWLSMGREHWPSKFPLQESQEVSSEKKKMTTGLVVVEHDSSGLSEIIEMDRFSSLGKLVRTTAWVLRFVNNLKAATKGNQTKVGELGVQEILVAEKLLIREVQNELQKLPKYKDLVIQLGIFNDGEVLRCRGRLGNSELELETKYPIILPNGHRFTQLVIEDCHLRVNHGGLKATLTEYWAKFWTTKGRQYVKKVIRNCSRCKRAEGKPYGVPPVAPLPEFRVEQVPPFTNVGVDFAGPLYFKSKNGKMEESYIVLFMCCTSRALHLDLVEDLSGPTFLRSFRRFSSRRGTPSLINSDNAKTFKFANNFLQKLANDHTVLSFLQERRITWRFNLEKSPWWGGYYERLVGSVKRCIKKVIGNARLSFDELSTILTEVEGTLNSRPITYVYDEVGAHPPPPYPIPFSSW